MDLLIVRHRDAINAIAAENGLCNVRLFGSRARGDYRLDSDLDLLVDRQVSRGHLLNIFNMTRRVRELTGLQVDVATEGMLYDSMPGQHPGRSGATVSPLNKELRKRMLDGDRLQVIFSPAAPALAWR